MIFDISDIQKNYAKQMEGLATVHDGSVSSESKLSLGLGYWLANVIGVSADGGWIVPAYSELYSLEAEVTSENKEILSAIGRVCAAIGKAGIWVLDRGGDRIELMRRLLRDEIYFVIRQTGRRNLWYRGKCRSLRWVSRKVMLGYSFRVKKKRKNRLVERVYCAGAVPVRLTKNGRDLWLVVSKAAGRGYTWYLAHLPSTEEKGAVELALQGYGYRWKVEEVHRHVKEQYNWEGICLRRYVALKNMNAVFWMGLYATGVSASGPVYSLEFDIPS